MTRGPRRLKEDPDFKWETGCDVADESLLVGEYDLPGTRSRLLAAIALTTPVGGEAPPETIVTTTVGDGIPAIRPGAASSSWSLFKPLAVAVTGAFVVAASYWVGVQVGSDDSVQELAPLEAPAVNPTVETQGTGVSGTSAEVARPAAEVVATTSAPGTAAPDLVVSPHVRPISKSAPVKALPAKAEPVAPEVVLPTELVAAQQAAAAVEQLEASGTAESPEMGSAALKPQSTLPAEAIAYKSGEQALFDGDYKLARTRFEGYLARFPQGKYQVEAKLGILHALFGLEDVAATESFARSIQDLPSLSGRRAEILQLRAESLVLLDRCEEALLVAGEIPSKAAAEVRRVCRRSGKESP
jgi:TolA-binding protein